MLPGAGHVRRVDVGETNARRERARKAAATADNHFNRWLCVTCTIYKQMHASDRTGSCKCTTLSMQGTRLGHAGALEPSSKGHAWLMQTHGITDAGGWLLSSTRMEDGMQVRNGLAAGERIGARKATDASCPWTARGRRPAPRVGPICRRWKVPPPAGDETTPPKKVTNQ